MSSGDPQPHSANCKSTSGGDRAGEDETEYTGDRGEWNEPGVAGTWLRLIEHSRRSEACGKRREGGKVVASEKR